ncbi:MAG: 6-phosphofructokinase [candidate division KSB1 bacterium]|nr:6-phosphofructokinase [candidate division KSB1 bacterium]MDZ7414163.1 6-phosphofructokinase [candidate division KSB1 bacterium]
MRTLGILTNGGDTCSLNAVIKSIRDNAIEAGFPRVLGFEDGYKGVMTKSVRLLTWEPIDPYQGGTILRSRRDAPRSDDDKRILFENLCELEVDTLIVIGGDGSLSATRELFEWSGSSNYPVKILGFPRTIDNDIRTNTFEGSVEVALCPGYPSAALKIARLTRDLRTTAMSTRRVFTLETMGRDAGWLAAAASLGGAEFVLIPEVPMEDADWERFYDRVAKLYKVNGGHVIIAVSEGFKFKGTQEMDAAFGPRKLGGAGVKVAKMVEKALTERGLDGVEVRCQHADYIPRMGRPSEYDVALAFALGKEIKAMLHDQRNGELPIPTRVVSGPDIEKHIARIPLSRASQLLFPADEFYNKDKFSVSDAFIDFVKKIVDPREL